MLEFFSKLFDTQGFPPRRYCGVAWTDEHAWLHILSDSSIALAYFSIPLLIGYFIYKRGDVPFLPLFILFAAFIFSCGLTHLIDATIFWHPWYRLSGVVKLITAIVSCLTVLALIPTIPKALKLTTAASLNTALQAEIREREQIETQLRRERAEMQLILDSIPSMVIFKDLQNRILKVNRAVLDTWNMTREQIEGGQVEALYPDEADQFLKDDQEIIATGKPKLGYLQKIKGQLIQTDKIPIKDANNAITHFIVVASNVTSEKKAEEYMQATFDASPVGMILVNSSQNIVMNNQCVQAMFGYSETEISQQDLNILLPEKIRKVHTTDFRQYLENPTARAMGKGRFLEGQKSNGETFPVEVALNPIRTVDGLHILASIVDITERVAAEKALKESNEELKQFAYVASHDLQTPLRGIAGFAHFLREDFKEVLDDKANEYIDRIISSCERMRMLIQDLLAYSKLENTSDRHRQVELNQVFDEVLESIKPTIEESGALVTRDDLPTIRGDASQLAHVFQNLIENGIKYNTQATPTVQVSSQRKGDRWEIIVRDNGIGIEKEFQGRIFEIFQRLHTQSEYPGTGIGLAFSRKIIQRHKGKLQVESEPDEGSTFSFTLRPYQDQ